MKNYYWLPFKDDGWHSDTLKRMNNNDFILPFLDGTSAARSSLGASRPAGAWSDVGSSDQLFIGGHGHKYSTEKITWVLPGNNKSWTASQLASAIKLNLANGAQRKIDFHVLACFGANNITPLSKSFGSKLAKELKARGFRGTVTAYKGATGMLGAQGHQTGSSRITALPQFAFGGQASTTGPLTTESGVTWQLHQ
ncbi:hypothetical protein CW745_01235 [Psychromonas sp. psych-6C06]|uniref:hypothetical protein n=1 Tax=Psychromonas sp. psych-6C06 TaxID=2058089 RepID=UPI000C335F39|nr:hypothetical protein [Psychromonas sp. psych-6C06]PKF63503.1 hypothetical protein CW745_01235 [Psychromonas sp. psych-6C06]